MRAHPENGGRRHRWKPADANLRRFRIDMIASSELLHQAILLIYFYKN
jgi:hypothetical protein